MVSLNGRTKESPLEYTNKKRSYSPDSLSYSNIEICFVWHRECKPNGRENRELDYWAENYDYHRVPVKSIVPGSHQNFWHTQITLIIWIVSSSTLSLICKIKDTEHESPRAEIVSRTHTKIWNCANQNVCCGKRDIREDGQYFPIVPQTVLTTTAST